MPAIEVEALTKEFLTKEKEAGLKGSIKSVVRPRYRRIRAVDGISFSIDGGELLAFIGPNGAGKSTTIKMLTGILFPTSGRAEVLGLTPWEARQRLAFSIGSVFGQRSQLWYHLPAVDSFNLLAKIYEIPWDIFRGRLAYLAETFELGELLKAPVRKLSLGQRMRCEIAASLLHSPRIVFLDEPTIGLDVAAKLRVRDLIKRINDEEGVTVFLTSHDVGDIEELCRRVIVINHGGIVLDTTVDALKKEYIKSKVIDLKLDSVVGDFRMDGVRVLRRGEHDLKLEVDVRSQIVDEVIQKIMRESKVLDITISDPPMEEIIRDIYARTGRIEFHSI